MRFLVTNDDGYLAPGVRALARSLTALGEVAIVAPDREQSATSHSLTLHHPLRARKIEDGLWSVDGTPTDCVMLAVHALFEEKPDYVFSGINHGGNMGEDVLYSGTVSAAMEGTLLGIPSISISLVHGDERWLEGYEELVRRLARRIVSEPERDVFQASTLLNINLPDRHSGEIRGLKVTTLGKRFYTDPVVIDKDPHGKTYYWIGGGAATWESPEGSDYWAVEQGYVSITPIHLDLTHHRVIDRLRKWEQTALGART